jgi:hypothetical protein
MEGKGGKRMKMCKKSEGRKILSIWVRQCTIYCFFLLFFPTTQLFFYGCIENPSNAQENRETNVDLAKAIVGKWKVTNPGYKNEKANGVVTFKSDGTYTIESGYFEAGGSWDTPPVTSGKYFIVENVAIGFIYDNAELSPDLKVNRFALVISKEADKFIISVIGHSHGVEILERIISP